MTLGRQLAIAISVVFLVALAGLQVIYLRSVQAHLQQQLESLAQDAATSLGLSLGAMMKSVDPTLAETIINPVFDRGHYSRVQFAAASGEIVVDRALPLADGDYPEWFTSLFPLHAPSAQSMVSAGWRQLGKLSVTMHPRFAYEQLWSTARDTVVYLVLVYLLVLAAMRAFLRGILQPLAAVERAAQDIAARNFVSIGLRPRARELARVVEAINLLSRQVDDAITAETKRAERLQTAAYHDDVTGLANAQGFATHFDSIYEADDEEFVGIVALVQVAELAEINTRLGAERCNELLQALGRRVAEIAAAAQGSAGRWRGALLIVAAPDPKAPDALLAELRAACSAVVAEYGLEGLERCYCGAAELRTGSMPLAGLVHVAEEALLAARSSEDGIALLPAVQAGTAQSQDSASAARDALHEGRIELAGQPVFRYSDHRRLHTEIMARLRDARGNLITAAQFMPALAAQGLVEDLDRSVIELALRAARAREDEVLALNVSIRSVQSAAFSAWLVARLGEQRGVAKRVVFELAEHAARQDEPAAATFARAVRAAGAGFAIDRFGVYRDSLVLVQRLRPAYVKLAGVHTPGLLKDAGARFFAEALIAAAQRLEVPVIAQNLEDDATFQAIAALGFAGYQGNLGGGAVPWR
jgi:EAL domain-containing protein (putative c-di-GMP-specific phosphodiesterase class I)/GGDEF domain-containing protein